MSKQTTPRIIDHNNGQITAELGGEEIRGWSYADDAERRCKMIAAREFTEGWFQRGKIANTATISELPRNQGR